MATATQNFGTNTALTVTNLHSLSDGAWWQSAKIDNGTIKGFWMELFVTILTTTSSGDAKGSVDVYLAASVDGGTDYAGGASGAEGSYTPVDESDAQLRHLAAMPVKADSVTARTFKFNIAVHDIGEDFSIVVENNTGVALGATINAVEYRLHKYDSA